MTADQIGGGGSGAGDGQGDDSLPARIGDSRDESADGLEGTSPRPGAAATVSDGGRAKRPKLPRPEGQQACPRCESLDTKFAFFNNYDVKQPRYFCRACQRYWTAGGALRDVPVGAGKRKSKKVRSNAAAAAAAEPSAPSFDSAGFSGGGAPVPPLLPGALVMDPLLAFGIAPAPAALLPVGPVADDGAAAAESAPNPKASNSDGDTGLRSQAAVEAGAAAGRRTRPKLDYEPPAADGSLGGLAASGFQVGGIPASTAAVLPYNAAAAAMDWFSMAAGQHPQAAAAAQAQMQAGYGQPQFGMPGMWPMPGYAAFPPGWPAPFPRFPGFGAIDPAIAAGGAAAAAAGANPAAAMSLPVLQGGGVPWPGWGPATLPAAMVVVPPAAPEPLAALPDPDPAGVASMVPVPAAPPHADGGGGVGRKDKQTD